MPGLMDLNNQNEEKKGSSDLDNNSNNRTSEKDSLISKFKKYWQFKRFRYIFISLIVVLLISGTGFGYYGYRSVKENDIITNVENNEGSENNVEVSDLLDHATNDNKDNSEASNENESIDNSTENNNITPEKIAISSEEENSSSEESASYDNKTVNNNMEKFTSFSTGNCTALVPEGWTGISNGQGTGADFYNSNQTEGSGWFIAPILYGIYGTNVEDAVSGIFSFGGNTGFTFTDGGSDAGYGFTERGFTVTDSSGQSLKGIAYYKTYSMDPYGYVLSFYSGQTRSDLWGSNGHLAAKSAISIRCQVSYTPSYSDGFDGSQSVTSSDENKESVLDRWSQEAILETETVHSPSTGETWDVSIHDYSETGLQGGDPGYYRVIDGNGTVERLESGFGDY